MESREVLEKRVADLERQVAALERGGRFAVGGGAVGYYACGGAAAGEHVIDAGHRDPEAERFFREHGLPVPGQPRQARP